MRQLVQLQERAGDLFKEFNVRVIVVFREESEGQRGLQKVAKQTGTEFTLALDANAAQTSLYSPGERTHDSYLIDSEGVIRAILAGTRYDRAQADEFAEALHSIAKRCAGNLSSDACHSSCCALSGITMIAWFGYPGRRSAALAASLCPGLICGFSTSRF